ncbi:hypothetical protein BDN70DRAFT_481597 [Pholiota conissans]|uniref:Heterokaryon incompatibility domain-containing protein n=1 Tax=Pholiota conissans TaxID=109636 RepID=A0A9P5Z7L0_9AGAR|nr:hypothetical protein BDN70DRAFT_481597 [Pholiota conissans]
MTSAVNNDGADEALLQALYNFVTPFVHPSAKIYLENPSHSRPEAQNLLNALKTYISCIIGTHESKPVRSTIDIDIETGAEDHIDSDVTENLKQGENSRVGNTHDAVPLKLAKDIRVNQATGALPNLSFHNKVIQALREHIFNKLPIRMICFQPRGTKLEINLLERGAIYGYLLPIIQEKIQDQYYQPRFSEFYDRIETENDAAERLVKNNVAYAILSHTWLRSSPGEVTYGDWNNGSFDSNSQGYQKIVNFCRIAWTEHGLTLGWMDTLCINKESSSELDESIRSMFKWYERSKVCITYLAETRGISDAYLDPWFTRGWTLQELLAPDVIKFYNTDWERLVEDSENDKNDSDDIIDQIHKATTLSQLELESYYDAPLSRRMQWAAAREVTREEDKAYSLMGIFDVSFATAYGEGADRAFYRLLQEILNSESVGVLDIFNWSGRAEHSYSRSEILPPNPQVFQHRSSDTYLHRIRPLEPLTLTHMGLRIPTLLMPGISINSNIQSRIESIGNYTATVNITPVQPYLKNIPTSYRLLDSRVGGSDGERAQEPGIHQYTFAVYNIGHGTQGIILPRLCIAIALQCAEDAGKVTSIGMSNPIQTCDPIVFQMGRNGSENARLNEPNEDLYGTLVEIPVEELPMHGMQLISIYL